MFTKKRIIIIAAVALFCLAGAGVLAVGLLFFAGHETGSPDGAGLRFYQFQQTPSAHPGYLRNTLTSGSDVYVSDYEEQALRLGTSDPRPVIGGFGMAGAAKLCAIPGLPATTYVAGDDGGEMPGWQVYRHNGHPPFDWRSATFREMTYIAPRAANTGQKSTDPALLTEVVTLLRDGTPVDLPPFPMTSAASMASLNLASDQLPGIYFCPFVHIDAEGTIYVTESLMLDTTSTPPQYHAHWIPASPKLTQWLQGR